MKYCQLLIFSLLLFLTSCHKRTPRSVVNILQQAEALLSEHPDSSLHLLQSINPDLLYTTRRKAQFALLYCDAKNLNDLSTPYDTLPDIAVNYYLRHGNDDQKARVYYHRALFLEGSDNKDKAIKLFLKARNLIENTDNETIKYQIYIHLAMIYRANKDLDKCINYLILSIYTARKCSNKTYLANALFLRGCLDRNSQGTNSLEDLYKAQELYSETKNKAMALRSYTSALQLQIRKVQDTDSIRMIKNKFFRAYNTYTNDTIPQADLAYLGYVYHKLGQQDSARYYFKLYQHYYPNPDLHDVGVDKWLSKVEEASGNLAKALYYERVYNQKKDSLTNFRKNFLIKNLEDKYLIEVLNAKQDIARKYQHYENIIFLLIMLLSVSSAHIIITRLKNSVRKKNLEITTYINNLQESREFYTKLSEEYQSIKQDLTTKNADNALLLNILNNRIQNIKTVLDLYTKYNKDCKEFFKQIKDIITISAGKNKELSDQVISIVNLTHHNIVNKLAQNFPELTYHELSYLAFMLLGFSQESMRVLYNHTNTASLYTLRSKIRSKLNLKDSAVNLEQFLKEQEDMLSNTQSSSE